MNSLTWSSAKFVLVDAITKAMDDTLITKLMNTGYWFSEDFKRYSPNNKVASKALHGLSNSPKDWHDKIERVDGCHNCGSLSQASQQASEPIDEEAFFLSGVISRGLRAFGVHHVCVVCASCVV